MGQRAPSSTQIAVAVAFAFSCFGLLLFLWNAFGGPVPFAPQGYQVKVPVNEGVHLAVESDVRISNVSVGRVKDIELEDEGENRDLAIATLEIEDTYAPLPNDTRAILRQKTLLGETYIDLSQGNKDSGTIPEGDTLPKMQVSESVQLDEIFRTFDTRTRAAFQTWMQSAALATQGRGADLSAAIANLEPFAEDANKLLRVLDTQDRAVQQFVKNTGVVFGALSERQGQLQGLIRNSATVFDTTARRDDELRETFIALPTFLDESRLTLERLETFSQNTNPLITQLRPAGRELSSTLKLTARVAPDFRGFFAGFRKLALRGPRGLQAVRDLLEQDFPPLLAQIQPFTQQLNPIVEVAGRFQRDIAGFLGNVTAATNAVASAAEAGGATTHYIRSSAPLGPDGLATYPTNRLQWSRANAYPLPGNSLNVANPLSFETRHCGGPPGVVANLNEGLTVGNPAFDPRATFDTPQELFDLIQHYAFRDETNTNQVPQTQCVKQPPQQSVGQIPELSDYLHTYREAP